MMDRRSFLSVLASLPLVGGALAKLADTPMATSAPPALKKKATPKSVLPDEVWVGDSFYHAPSKTRAIVRSRRDGLIGLQSLPARESSQEFYMREAELLSGEYIFLGNSVSWYFPVGNRTK